MKKMIGCLVVVLLAVPLFSGCRNAPITGRRQLILIGQEQEMQLGQQAFAQVLQESKLSGNAQATAIVERVGKRVAEAAARMDRERKFAVDVSKFQWEFKLIESDEANAFCLPGGKVAVYTGILPYCKNEAGLAAVVGHEVAHAIANHGAERISHSVITQFGAQALQLGITKMSPTMQQGIMTAFGLGANVGVLLPYSRIQESEADEIGIYLSTEAGYDPQAAVDLWTRMAEGAKKAPEFLSTHPATENRIEHLKSLLPKMRKLYNTQPERYGEGVDLSS